MVFTGDESGANTPWIYVGQAIYNYSFWEVKGTGSFRGRIELRNSAGSLIDKMKFGPFDEDDPTFVTHGLSLFFSSEVPGVAGYYTVKTIYVDVATGNTWSHQTKIHVLAPD